MANGSPTRPRATGVFSGLLLIVFGILLLLHNYGHLQITNVFKHWWPLIFIFWGATKLYERTIAQRQGRSSGWITPGEVFLVLGLMTIVGIVVTIDSVKHKIPIDFVDLGGLHSIDFDVAPQTLPANAHITIRAGRGNITVRSSEDQTLRITGQKQIHAWSDEDADRQARKVDVSVLNHGGAYEITPTGFDLGDSRIALDMDVVLPKKSVLAVRNDHGDITVSDMGGDVAISTKKGTIEVNDTAGNVDIETRSGDVKVTDTKGDIKIAGHGGEVEALNATGSLLVDGEFYGSIRADKIAKGVRFLSQRTDLTLTQLGGHFEKGSGNMEIADAPGNLTSRTRNVSVSLENVTGKIVLDNTNGSIELRFSNPPKEDITINNERASVTLLMPSASNFDIQADCRSCDINSEFNGNSLTPTRTEKGDSHLEGKYGAARGPKITLKSSYDAIEIRKTT
jgi:DUF4097 and DUF4098 domain-containing protein YvlB